MAQLKQQEPTTPEVPPEEQPKENKKDVHVLGEIAGGFLISATMVACLSLWALSMAGLATL